MKGLPTLRPAASSAITLDGGPAGAFSEQPSANRLGGEKEEEGGVEPAQENGHGHGHGSALNSKAPGYDAPAGLEREDEGKPTCMVTMLSSKQLQEIRGDLVELAKENAELKHQKGVLEAMLADAQFHCRLYWNCGVAWARAELEWIKEREMLKRRVDEGEQMRRTTSDGDSHSLDGQETSLDQGGH
ncbi:hypothetical protein PV08_07092 [Exophiala spinifera]|uniref:Uncharacterized protein n=1 Tax=Exophiala spinifera TaxID=91928 RepID=A0A0D2B6J0_9EURO|nr:uncharacterized protein PV08_07092 [Exophiala spinifera]KIW14310.1 hypothetical protein PV08_07092 [Exophiala spinifera]